MKNLFNNISNTTRSIAVRVSDTHRRAVAGHAGEGYVDTAVKILISVVLGALLLAGLYALFNTTVMPAVTERINAMFNYGG